MSTDDDRGKCYYVYTPDASGPGYKHLLTIPRHAWIYSEGQHADHFPMTRPRWMHGEGHALSAGKAHTSQLHTTLVDLP